MPSERVQRRIDALLDEADAVEGKSMPDEENMVEYVFASKSADEVRKRYDEWAGDYDSDLADKFGYPLPERAAEAFAGVVPPEARVLDAGVGTGLVGVFLARKGFTDIVGIDISQGMLDQAAAKSVYAELRQMDLGEPLDLADGGFDAVISTGSFGPGHAPASCLDELARVTKPGGAVMYSLPRGLDGAAPYESKANELVAAGVWELVSVGDRFQPMPVGEPEVFTNLWHFRVL